MLIISDANRWRHLLTIYRLGWGWLHCYPVAADLLSAGPSRGQCQLKAKLNPASVGGPSTQMDCLPLTTPLDTDADVDSPMEDSLESEDDSNYIFHEEEDYDSNRSAGWWVLHALQIYTTLHTTSHWG